MRRSFSELRMNKVRTQSKKIEMSKAQKAMKNLED